MFILVLISLAGGWLFYSWLLMVVWGIVAPGFSMETISYMQGLKFGGIIYAISIPMTIIGGIMSFAAMKDANVRYGTKGQWPPF